MKCLYPGPVSLLCAAYFLVPVIASKSSHPFLGAFVALWMCALIIVTYVFRRHLMVMPGPDRHLDSSSAGVYGAIAATGCALLTLVPILMSAWARPGLEVTLAGMATGLVLSACLLARWPALVRAAKISLLLVASVIVTGWPLRISFFLAQDQLEDLAAAVEAGINPPTPIKAGVFEVRKTEIRQAHGFRIRCLWLTPESGQPSVLAQCASSEIQFNVQTGTILSRRWQFITEG